MSTDYKTLATPAYRDLPRFGAVLDAITQPLADVVSTAAGLIADFDLDTAEGAQLDKVGEWVGITRAVITPVPNQFFTWNSTTKGWNAGYWKGPFTPVDGVSLLDDTSYRAALRFKIAQNHWEGPLSGFNSFFVRLEAASENIVIVHDNMDMTMSVSFFGPIMSNFLRLFIEQQDMVPRPMGVAISGYTYGLTGTGGGTGAMPATPLFGLDISNGTINGLDFGYLI